MTKKQIENDSINDDVSEQMIAELTCAICLDEFPESDCKVVVLPCHRHTFHQACIEKWLKVNSVCPECRFEVTESNLLKQKKIIKKAKKETKKKSNNGSIQ